MPQPKTKPHREATEAQRNETVSRSAAIARSSEEAFIGTDLVGRITAWNPAAETIYGYSPDEAIGKPTSILVVPENKAETDRITNGVDKGEAFRLDTQHLTKNGKRIDVSISVEPMRKDGGDIIGAALIARDITEQKNKDKVLKKTFLDARNVIEASLDSWVAIGPDGKIIDVNNAAEQLTGIDREELIGSDFSGYFTEPDKAREIYQLVFRHGFLKDYPLTARAGSGKTTKLLFNASVFTDEAGEIQGVFAAARDITDIEQELGKAEKSLASILNSIDDAFFTLDGQWNFIYLNRKAEALLQRKPGELQGKNIWSELPETIGTKVYQEYHKVIAKQAPIEFEGHFGNLDKWFWVHIYPYEDGLSVYFSDITERKNAEKTLRAHIRQEASVSELGQHALSGIALPKLFNEAVIIVASCLEVEYATILERLSGDKEFVLKAGFGLGEEVIGTKISSDTDTQSGYTINVGRPTFVEDLSKETRFHGSSLLKELEVVSGMTVIIPGKEPYGVLAAHTSRKRTFTDDEINFLQAIANILSAAVTREDEKVQRTNFENEISQSEEKYRQIVTTAQEGIWAIDSQNNTSFVNDAMAKILGYSIREMLGKSLFEFMDKEGAKTSKAIVERGRQGLAQTHELKFRHKDGAELWTSMNTGPLLGKQGQYEGTLAMATDITERRARDEKIRFMAFHDILTGLPNRVLFDRQISEELDKARENKAAVGFLYLDIDNFKAVKNTIGHDNAEQLLKLIVGQIQNLLQNEDSMARLGEDEFLIALLHLNEKKKTEGVAVNYAKNIIALFSKPWKVAGRELNMVVNMGLAFYPKDGGDVKALRENADVAMLRSKKKSGPNSYNTYQQTMKSLNKQANDRLDIESRLSNALGHEEFELHYQPVFDTITNEIAYAETLIRWNSSSGLISPSEFIPMAEETGQIAYITQWVLAETCRRHREWLSKGLEPVKTTVNLSATGFQQPSLAPTIIAFLKKSGVDPKYVGFELTESALMVNPMMSVETMKKLKEFGVSLHLDDFGTGYSSLAYFKEFPVDETKIDMSFIENITTDVASEAIVKAIIILSHGLELKVTAEGVETQGQYEKLKALGCDDIQGFLFSKPLSASDFERSMHKRAA